MEHRRDLTPALLAMRRRAWIVAASLAVAVAAAYGVTQWVTPRYKATATLFVAPNPVMEDASAAVQYATLAQGLVTAYARLAETRAVVDAAAQRAGLPRGAVAEHFNAGFEDRVQILTITADAPSGERAAGVANAVADALSARVGALSNSSPGRIGLEVVDRAAPASKPASPILALNLVFGALAGLLLGVGIAVLLERLDQRIRTAAEAEEALGLPVLGVVTRFRRKDARRDALGRHADPRIAEPFRSLAITLAPLADRGRQRTLLLTSASPGDGKSTVAAHLALALAEQGRPTTLVEADLRRPSLRSHFGLTKALTVRDALRGLNGPPPTTGQVIPNLTVIPAGRIDGDVAMVLRGEEFQRMLEGCQRNSDLVLLDAPPALPTSDVGVMAPYVDAVILVVRSGETRVDACQETLASFKRIGVEVAGVVLTRARASRYSGYYAERPSSALSAERRLKALRGADSA